MMLSNPLQETSRYFMQSIHCVKCNARLREAQSSADQIKLRVVRLITSRRNNAGCLTCTSYAKPTHILGKYFSFLPSYSRNPVHVNPIKEHGETISPGNSSFRNRANTRPDLANARFNRVNVTGQNTKRSETSPEVAKFACSRTRDVLGDMWNDSRISQGRLTDSGCPK